jgi:hypothetical protein
LMMRATLADRKRTSMFDFNPILNWKLLAGSHEFPGPAGGTCINEAAIVAAGFAYREIGSPDDCPPCFSRVLAAYALSLNDRIQDDELRQQLLMPFVTRLAGSADTEAVEERRAARIIAAVVGRVLPPALEFTGLFNVAMACRSAGTIAETRAAMAVSVEVIEKMIRFDENLSHVFDDPLLMVADALRDLLLYEAWGKTQPMLHAGDLAAYADTILHGRQGAKSTRVAEPRFAAAAAILGEALDIGKQADAVAAETILSRFEKAKRVERESAAAKVLILADAA